jgi:hypothetical protein
MKVNDKQTAVNQCSLRFVFLYNIQLQTIILSQLIINLHFFQSGLGNSRIGL